MPDHVTKPEEQVQSQPQPAKTTVTDCLDMAMAGVSMTIRAMLDNHEDNHRFSEVMRLAVIGKALGRQRARASKRVADFDRDVVNARRMQGCGRPGVDPELGMDLQAVHELAMEGEQDPPGAGYVFPRMANPGWIGAPYGVVGPDPGGDQAVGAGAVAGAAEAMRPVVDAMERMSGLKERDVASKVNLDRARELETLVRVHETLDDGQVKETVRRRIEQITADLSTIAVEPSRADEIVIEEKRPDVPAASTSIRCPNCGTVHGAHWVNAIGEPMRCDVCGSATIFERADATPRPQAAEDQGT